MDTLGHFQDRCPKQARHSTGQKRLCRSQHSEGVHIYLEVLQRVSAVLCCQRASVRKPGEHIALSRSTRVFLRACNVAVSPDANACMCKRLHVATRSNSLPAIPHTPDSPIPRGSLEHSHAMRVRVNRLGTLVLLQYLRCSSTLVSVTL